MRCLEFGMHQLEMRGKQFLKTRSSGGGLRRMKLEYRGLLRLLGLSGLLELPAITSGLLG